MKADVTVNPVRRGRDAWVPALVVVVILGLLHDSRTGRLPGGVAVFSHNEATVDREDFKGGLVSVFGSNRLDVRRDAFRAGMPDIGAFAMFGRVEVVVPRGTRVVGGRVPLLGDVRVHTAVVDESAPQIRVNAVALFGSVVVHD